MENPKLRVAFLVGSDNPSTRRSIEAVCRSSGVEPAGVLLDTGVVPFKRRLKHLSRNIRANGWSYLLFRAVEVIRRITDAAVENAPVSRAEVMSVLRRAFPDRCFTLADLGARYGMRVHAVGSLNGANAVRVLSECGADLGIVLGTRILKPGTFGVPRMGCINLHKGGCRSIGACRLGFGSFTMGRCRPASPCTLSTRVWILAISLPPVQYPLWGPTRPKALWRNCTRKVRGCSPHSSTIRSGKASPQPREKLRSSPGPGPPEKRSVCFGGVYSLKHGATFRRFCEICIFCLSTTVASTTSPANFTVCCGGQEVRFTPTIESTIIRRMS